MTVEEHELLKIQMGTKGSGNLSEEMKRIVEELTGGLKASFIRVRPGKAAEPATGKDATQPGQE